MNYSPYNGGYLWITLLITAGIYELLSLQRQVSMNYSPYKGGYLWITLLITVGIYELLSL